MLRKIAIVSDHASPLAAAGGVDSGGQNIYVAQVARNLAELGYTVDVFTRRDAPDQPEVQPWGRGVRVVHVPAGPPRFVQQVDIRPAPVVVQEHRGAAVWCPRCCKAHQPPFPAAVEAGGLVGPRLTTLIAYLKGVCHASFSTVRKFLKEVIGLSISRGQLAKVVAKASEALAGPYAELLAELPGQGVLNVDETGHKDKGRAMWTWCFRAGSPSMASPVKPRYPRPWSPSPMRSKCAGIRHSASKTTRSRGSQR